jgi:UDP-N-acetylglucosamine 1-carboxyvinyltransferase
VTGSELTIAPVVPDDLHMIRLVFQRLGVRSELQGDALHVPRHGPLRIVADVHEAIPKVDDGPWPAFPADLISVAVVVATQAEGTVLIWEKMFESRLFFVDKLLAMGARLVLCDPHRLVVVGPAPLHGEEMVSPDIRAGIALLIATLCAEGQSTIRNIQQIDRGYERIEQRLSALGAHIQRVRES